MNMILHGIESPNIIHQNTLETNIQEIQNKDRVDVILANPPFGGKEKANIQENFPIKTGETAYLFLQHFIKKLKAGGKCGVVIKNTFLSNTDNASVALRKQLLEECNLFTILNLPKGTFLGSGVQTIVLFFEKGKPTKKIWYYQLNVSRNMGKTNALNENDLSDFVKLSKTNKLSDNSWSIDKKKIDKGTWDLEVNNPNRIEEIDERTPAEFFAEIDELDKKSTKALQKIKKLKKNFTESQKDWLTAEIGDLCESLFAGGDVQKNKLSKFKTDKFNVPIFTNGEKNKGLYGFTDKARVFKPSITVSARGTIGYSELRTEPFYPAVRLIVVTPKTDIIDTRYLKHAIKNISFLNTGSSIPQLTVPMVKKYKIKFPKSKDAQKKIVVMLDDLSSEITELTNISKIKTEKYILLQKSILTLELNNKTI